MSQHFDDDRPMTEEQWEKMMRESDLKAARFGELLETLREHPERDQIVAREMGWNELADALAQSQYDDDYPDATRASDEPAQADEPDIDMSTYHEDRDHELQQIHAYVVCEQTAHAVSDALAPFQSPDVRLDETLGELIGHAFIGIHIACAKISGGHAMGYDDDVLGGNIVNNKRALEGARQSIDAFEQLALRKVLPAERVRKLLEMLNESAAAIDARIAELRSRVWWS
jgi:hypothetical protein